MLVVRLYLSIKRKVIKSHGTDEVDVSGLTVHDLLISGDPQTGVFGQHLHNLIISNNNHYIRPLMTKPPPIMHLECLEVVDEDIW